MPDDHCGKILDTAEAFLETHPALADGAHVQVIGKGRYPGGMSMSLSVDGVGYIVSAEWVGP